MLFLSNSSGFFKSELSPCSTGACPSDGRRWWQAEAAVNGFDWSNLIALHLNIVDLLRGSSS
jgi:hypothetical protein